MPDVLACSPATWTLFRQFRGIGPVADGGPEALEIQWNFAMSAESAGAPGKPAKSRVRNIPPIAVQHDQTRAGVSVWSAAIPFDAATLLLHAARSFFRCSSNNTSSFPRRVFCARGLKLWLRYPRFKGWRSAERRTDACEASVGPARNAAGQAPTEAPCVP